MQVYKAWSVAFSRACEGDKAPALPAPSPSASEVVVLPPITVVVRRPKRSSAKATSAPCPLKPPCPVQPVPLRTRYSQPAGATKQADRSFGSAGRAQAAGRAEPAGTEVTQAWLRQAVGACLAAPNFGTEGLATLLEGRLDDGLARSLRDLRDSGRLPAAIDAALSADGLERRPDLPLERIISSALRRHALRPWLAAVASR